MNHLTKFLKPVSAGQECQQVQCSACAHAKEVRCTAEITDCLELFKMRNADQLRSCASFLPKAK